MSPIAQHSRYLTRAGIPFDYIHGSEGFCVLKLLPGFGPLFEPANEERV